MKRIYINTLILMLGLFASAQTTGDREYQVKAAFLFNFSQFVEWPSAVLPEPGAALVIGILGENPFDSYLQAIISGEVVNGHPLTIQQYKNVDEIKTCHILFINIHDTNKLIDVLTALKGRNILTVSDAGNFIRLGGMVTFITRHNKIRIRINPERAKDADLMISSKLLRVAEIVSQDNN